MWHDGLFRGSDRPWLVVSDDAHPFHGEAYLVVGITITERKGAIELQADDWTIGGLPKRSYVSPGFITPLKHTSIIQGVGQLESNVVDEIVTESTQYLN